MSKQGGERLRAVEFKKKEFQFLCPVWTIPCPIPSSMPGFAMENVAENVGRNEPACTCRDPCRRLLARCPQESFGGPHGSPQQPQHPQMRRRGHRHLLAHLRRLRQRGDRRQLPRGRHRPARRLACLRPDRAHHGLCHRPHLGLPPQPGRDRRARGGRALPEAGHRALHRGAGRRSGDRRGRRPLHHRHRLTRRSISPRALRPTATARTRRASTA